jgi:hypothetical protein
MPYISYTASSRPPCTFMWTGPNVPDDTTNDLYLQNINRNQKGTFHCTTTNEVGSKVSSNLVLDIKCKHSHDNDKRLNKRLDKFRLNIISIWLQTYIVQGYCKVLYLMSREPSFEDTKEVIKTEGGRTDNIMTKRIYKPRSTKTIYRKVRYGHYEPIKNTCARKEYAVPSPLVTPVVLHLCKRDTSWQEVGWTGLWLRQREHILINGAYIL